MCCPLAGLGIVRALPDLVAALRRNPVPPPGKPLAGSLLRHSDEQTVVALAAVYQAIHNHDLTSTDFTNWGVVAAPCFLGRATLAQALKRLTLEGAWGVSPHLIPHHSIHAVSGTISQALRIHGPNFGVGGGPGAVSEALTLTATLLADDTPQLCLSPDQKATGASEARQNTGLPGVWLVLTEYQPELIPGDPAQPSSPGQKEPPMALALALALVPRPAASIGINLLVCPQDNPMCKTGTAEWTTWPMLNTVSLLSEAFSESGPPRGRWRLGLTGWVELRSAPVRAPHFSLRPQYAGEGRPFSYAAPDHGTAAGPGNGAEKVR
jgi:hypothetical protein